MRGRLFRFLALMAIPAALLVLAPGRAALATTVTVTTTADELNSDGDCSLREAVQAANTDTAIDACSAGSGADTVVVPAGRYTLSIPGADEDGNLTGDLDITSDLTIEGAGAVIEACDSSNGPCTGIDRVLHVVDLEAVESTVAISGVTVRNGTLPSHVNGGGFANGGTLTVTGSTIGGNTAGAGGGIYNAPGATLDLVDSTITGNTAIYSGAIFNQGTLNITNSTVNGNVSTDSNAGGIFNQSGTVSITNSTVAGNTVAYGASGIVNVGGTMTLKNTIVANGPIRRNCAGAITSLGHNLSLDESCEFAGPGDLSSTDPMLGPLADNGGPALTQAPLAGSPAIDAGSGDCPPPATDQRGDARPQDGNGDGSAVCDIGALEVEPPAALPGDVDCNRAVTSIDAALILQHGAGLLASLSCAENGDTNGDGRIDSIDAALVLQLVAGLVQSLPG